MLDNVDDLDEMTAPPATTITASKLREGMVLLDPELGTPAVWVDQRTKTQRSSGQISFNGHDLDTGGVRRYNIGERTQVAVMAEAPAARISPEARREVEAPAPVPAAKPPVAVSTPDGVRALDKGDPVTVTGLDAYGSKITFTGTLDGVTEGTRRKTGEKVLQVGVKREGQSGMDRTDFVTIPTGEFKEKRGRGRPRTRPTADSLDEQARQAFEDGDEDRAGELQREADKIRTQDERTVAQKLASLSDAQLDTLMERVVASDDPSPHAMEALAAEEDRRRGGGVLDKDLAKALETDRVFKAEVARLRKESRMEGTARRRLDERRQREEWEAHQEARMVDAESETRGHMFKKSKATEGKPRLARDLFMGKLNAQTMRSIVSPEMAEWFGKHGWPVPYRIATADQATRNRHSDSRGQLGEWG